MKKIIMLALLFLLLNIVYAADLSDFPDIFIENGNLNAVIVVGNQAPASDAISQSNLVQFFVGYLGKTVIGSTKLSSEISDLNQNIISIGSPCHNPISAQIMNNQQPCDKDIMPGKALVKLSEKDGYVYMVIAGYSEKDTRKAVTDLINGNIDLYGNEQIVTVYESPNAEIAINDGEQTNLSADIESEKNKLIEDLNKKILNKTYEDNNQKTVADTTQNGTNVITWNEDKSIEEPQKNKGDTIFKKIINWILSLFR